MSLLVGVEYCKTDAQGRFKMPAAIKKQLDIASDNRYFIRKSIYNDCLEVFTYESFQKEVSFLNKNLNLYDPDSKKLYRRFIEGNMLEMDSFDRLLIPEMMRKSTNITKEIVIIGSGNFLEIWDADTYKKTSEDNFDYKQVAKNLLKTSNADKSV
ncbi:MAG: hypothetical protein IJ681_04395 [Bacteroidales bacterium]|nr:hypothetical protein [Bacteroidales bacterium]